MKQYIQILRKVWVAMVIMSFLLVAFTLAIYYFFGIEATFTGNKAVIFSYALMFLMVFCVFMASKSSRRKIQRLKEATLPEKAEKYRSILIRQLSFYNLVNFFALIGLLLCAQVSYVIFSVIALLLIALTRPNSLKLKIDLALSEEEINEFEKLKFERR